MRKKKYYILLLLLLAFSFYFCGNGYSSAATTITENPFPEQISSVREEAGDGYYITTLTTSPSTGFSAGLLSTTKELSCKKSVDYYNSNNTLCWTYILTGTFSVNIGISATCTNVTASLRNKKPSSYTVNSEKHTKSGNSCTGTISIKKSNGKIVTRTATITCSKNGKFS